MTSIDPVSGRLRRARAALGDSRITAHLRVPLFRTAYALMLSNVLTSGLGLAYWIAGARLYSAADVGLNSALISTMMFLSGISQMNLRSALNRFIPEAGRDAGRLIGGAFLATIPAAVVVVLVFVWGIALWAPQSPVAALSTDFPMLAWFIIATASWGIFNMQDGVLTGIQRAMVIPVENFIFAVAKLVLLIVLVGFAAQYGIFASWTIPALVAVVAVTVWVYRVPLRRRKRVASRARAFTARQFVRFSASDYLGALLVLTYISLLPVLVISSVGAQLGAYFYIVWIIATSLNLLPLSLSISHTVETVAAGADPVAEARTVLVHMVRILSPVVAVVVVGAPWILSIFGPGYAEAGSDFLRLMALGVLPYGINVLYFSLARIERRLRGVVAAQAFLAVVTPVGALVLLPVVGLTGVGIAWLASQSAVAAVLLATALRPLLRRVDPRPVEP